MRPALEPPASGRARCAGRRPALPERVNARQLPIQAGVVETVADDEAVRDGEAEEVDLDRDLAPGGPVEERRNAKRGGFQAADPSCYRAQRPPGVDYVLDQQHMASDERAIDHVREAKLATARS